MVLAEQDDPGDGGRTEAVPHLVHGGIEGVAAGAAIEGQDELDGRRGRPRLATATPTRVRPSRPDHRHGRADQLLTAARIDPVSDGRPGQRVRPGRPGEVVEAQPEDDGAPDTARSPHPARHPVDQCDDDGVDVLGGRSMTGRAPAANRSSGDVDPVAPGADHD